MDTKLKIIDILPTLHLQERVRRVGERREVTDLFIFYTYLCFHVLRTIIGSR
jgi:hypothetical protein